MGIYFKNLEIKVLFNDEIIIENFFKRSVAKLQIIIRVRDYNEGRSSNITRHKNSPSIKIIDYGRKGSRHNPKGDPVYFYLTNEGLSITYNENQFDSKEIKYIKNFIEHNCLNLRNYWYAPDYFKSYRELENYQDKIKDRILTNISTYDYTKPIGEIDEEIKY